VSWPDDASHASYDKTAYTWGINVDQTVWDALMAKSPLLDRVKRTPVDEVEFKWETANAPTRRYTCSNTTDTNLDGSATNTTLILTGGTPIQLGSILKNVSRATPVNAYGQDELLEVTANSSGTLTCTRDAGYVGTTPGQGSTAHVATDTFEVVYSPKQEGSSPDENKVKEVTLVSNYTNTVDFYLEVTGDYAASRPLVAGDNMQLQVKNAMRSLQNEMEGMLIYGALNNGANAGSSSYVRRTKGLDAFICASGGNLDYSTKAVTEPALNALVGAIVDDNTDPTDDFIIVCHPVWARDMSEQFGSDKVRITQSERSWGRYISTFMSSSGIDLDIVPSLNCSKSDLFILDMSKIALTVLQGFVQSSVNFSDDMVDKARQRTLGRFGVKCVDGLYSHAKLGYITWPS